jgi:hypothetical protein
MRAKFIAAACLAALIVFSLPTASAQGNRTVLRIDNVKLTKTECGKPLEFQVTIKNAGAMAFNREIAVVITSAGNKIGHQFVLNVNAGGTFTDTQASLNPAFQADCCKEVCFEVGLAATSNGGDVPEWNKVAYKLCTKPGNVVVVRR